MKSVRVIDLDPLALLYGRFSRSLRVLRAISGLAVGLCMTWMLYLALYILLFPLSKAYEMSVGEINFMGVLALCAAFLVLLIVVWCIGAFLVLLIVDWYIGIAACSVFALRRVTIMGGVYVLAILGILISMLVNDAHLLPFFAFGMLFSCTVWWLTLGGLWPLLERERAVERRLFATQLGESRFFRPVGMLIRDICRLAGLVIPPGGSQLKRMAIVAAIAALVIEGFTYGSYHMLGFALVKAAREDLAIVDRAELITADPIGQALVGAFAQASMSLVSARILFGIAGGLRRFALRRSVRTAEDARFGDKRPPILFLRSFRDDQVSLSEARLSFGLRFFDPGTQAGTLEALLMRVMTFAGPVIAIGTPGERIAPLGAARTYTGDQPWEDIVRDLIKEAGLIIVGLDATPGVLWELNEIAAQGALEKTLVIVPPVLAGKGELNLGILASVGIVPTGIATAGGNDIGFLFLPDETLVTLTSSTVSELEYEMALRLALLRVSPRWDHYDENSQSV